MRWTTATFALSASLVFGCLPEQASGEVLNEAAGGGAGATCGTRTALPGGAAGDCGAGTPEGSGGPSGGGGTSASGGAMGGIDESASGGTDPSAACCRVCKAGKACGDSCINRDLTCHKPPGCACDS